MLSGQLGWPQDLAAVPLPLGSTSTQIPLLLGYHFYSVLKLLIDWLIVQVEAAIPRRGMFAGIIIFKRFRFYLVMKLVTDWLIVQGEAVIPRRGIFAGLKIFLWFSSYLVLNPAIDWLIVQGEVMIPRRGKFVGLKIFLWFHLYLIPKPVIDWLIVQGEAMIPRRGKFAWILNLVIIPIGPIGPSGECPAQSRPVRCLSSRTGSSTAWGGKYPYISCSCSWSFDVLTILYLTRQADHRHGHWQSFSLGLVLQPESWHLECQPPAGLKIFLDPLLLGLKPVTDSWLFRERRWFQGGASMLASKSSSRSTSTQSVSRDWMIDCSGRGGDSKEGQIC